MHCAHQDEGQKPKPTLSASSSARALRIPAIIFAPPNLEKRSLISIRAESQAESACVSTLAVFCRSWIAR